MNTLVFANRRAAGASLWYSAGAESVPYRRSPRMPEAVYRMMTLLCSLVGSLPVGTNLGLLHLLWMLVSGQLLATRGALIPGLSACGLADRAVRRAWAVLGHGDWTSGHLLARWGALVAAEGRWQAHTHGGYHPVAVDVTGFWRPRLQDCPTTHYHAQAGKALPAIPLGLIARVGGVGRQRLALPLAFVRADGADPSSATQTRHLVQVAVQQCADDDALVLDAGFGIALLQDAGSTRYVVRVARNSTFRRATPPPYGGRGRPPTRGAVVRPLPRTAKGRTIPALARAPRPGHPPRLPGSPAPPNTGAPAARPRP